MRLFLLAGKANCGKTSMANFIKEYYVTRRKNVVATELGKYLKMYATELTEWDGTESTKPRKYLQDLGMIIRKDMHKPLFLINRLKEDIELYQLNNDVVIISDVRLPEEIEEFRNSYDDVITINVVNQYSADTLPIEEQMHYTELALENYTDYDYTIINEDLKTAREKVQQILTELDNES